MTDPEDPPGSTSQKPARKPDRAERLAEELRANLRRRKDQARSRGATGDPRPAAQHSDLDQGTADREEG